MVHSISVPYCHLRYFLLADVNNHSDIESLSPAPSSPIHSAWGFAVSQVRGRWAQFYQLHCDFIHDGEKLPVLFFIVYTRKI